MVSSLASKLRGMQRTANRRKSSSTPWMSFEKLEASLALSPVRPKPLPLYLRLREYQKEAVCFALNREGAGLFCDPRTGKTWIALAVVEQLEPDSVLIIVPLTNLVSTWVKWIREFLPQYTICRTWEEWKKAKGKKRLFLVHYEGLPSVINRLAKVAWGLVILDESQRIKARASRQSRQLRRLRRADRRLALSGTPLDDSEIDLWGQMRFIEPRSFGDVWGEFDHRFLKPTGFMGYKREMRESRKPEFNRRIRLSCLRITRDEAGIEAPKLRWYPVDLLGKQRRLYEDMEDEWLVDINEVRISSELEITKRGKLQQISNGFIFDEDRDVHWVGNAKIRALKYLLRHKLKPPAIIFFQYLPEAAMIAEACSAQSSRVRVLIGAVKDRKNKMARTELLRDFQAGKIDYLICQEKTGGVGIDLYAARNAVVYSFNESFIDFDQMKSRMDFVGLPAPTIFLIYAQGTIDDDKKEAVLSKRDLSEVVLNRLKRRRS